MNLNLRDLKYFEVITQEGSLALASERLSRSQPALSKCLQRLEETIGAPLFIRDGRGVHLTAVGEALLEKSRQLSKAVEQTEKDMHDFVLGENGNIRLGTIPSLTEHIVPVACKRFLKESPNVYIHLLQETADKLLDSLLNQRVDVIISLLTKNNDKVETFPLTEDPIVVVAHQDNPLFKLSQEKILTIDDLVNYQWVMTGAKSVVRLWLEQQFVSRGLPSAKVCMETQSFQMISRMVENSNFLTLLPRRSISTVEIQQKNIHELNIPEMVYNRQIGVTRLKNRTLSPAVDKMISILREMG